MGSSRERPFVLCGRGKGVVLWVLTMVQGGAGGLHGNISGLEECTPSEWTDMQRGAKERDL